MRDTGTTTSSLILPGLIVRSAGDKLEVEFIDPQPTPAPPQPPAPGDAGPEQDGASAPPLDLAPETGLARAARRPHEAATLAKRWAAKEACSKALGTGLAMGIAWRDMAVANLPGGQPTMQLTGWAAERLAAMTPPGHVARVHVTLTDDHPWAQAFVVIEAIPDAVSISATA